MPFFLWTSDDHVISPFDTGKESNIVQSWLLLGLCCFLAWKINPTENIRSIEIAFCPLLHFLDYVHLFFVVLFLNIKTCWPLMLLITKMISCIYGVNFMLANKCISQWCPKNPGLTRSNEVRSGWILLDAYWNCKKPIPTSYISHRIHGTIVYLPTLIP